MENTYCLNQKVIHCREGLCQIMSETNINGNDYFVVHSINGGGENIYVLKTRTENIIRPIMGINEAKDIIAYMNSIHEEFIANTKQRRDFYKKKLGSGNVKDLAFLAKQLYLFHYLNSIGTIVKLGPTDIEMLQSADKILFDEFSLVFEKNAADIKIYLIKKYNLQISA